MDNLPVSKFLLAFKARVQLFIKQILNLFLEFRRKLEVLC